MNDLSAQKHAADQDADTVDLGQAERVADQWLALALRKLAKDPRLLTQVHLKIENLLIEMRDSGMSVGVSAPGGGIHFPANGLVVKYRDGQPSDIIRLGTRDAVRTALEGAAEYLEGKRHT